MYTSSTPPPPPLGGPEAKTRGGIIVVCAHIQYIYSIYRKNVDLTKVGAQIVSGVVRNARKWVSVGVIKGVTILHSVDVVRQ